MAFGDYPTRKYFVEPNPFDSRNILDFREAENLLKLQCAKVKTNRLGEASLHKIHEPKKSLGRLVESSTGPIPGADPISLPRLFLA